MNCNELHKDIDELKASCATLQEGYNRMNNELSGKAEFKNDYHKTEQLSDKILEKYLSDFTEKNPELSEWQNRKLKPLFNQFDDPMGIINKAIIMPNKNIAISNDPTYDVEKLERICVYNQDAQGNYVLKGETDDALRIRDIVPLSDESLLGSTYLGEIYEYRIISEQKNEKEHTIVKKKIMNPPTDNVTKAKILPTSDKSALVWSHGELREITKKANQGDWEIGEPIEGIDKDKEILSISQMPDGGVMVGFTGVNYDLCIFKKQENGEWDSGKKIEGFSTSFRTGAPGAKRVVQVSNQGMLILGDDAIFEYNKGPDNQWVLGDNLFDVLKGKEIIGDSSFIPTSAVRLSDKEILLDYVGGTLRYNQSDNGNWSFIKDNTIQDFKKQNEIKYFSTILPLNSKKIITLNNKFNENRNIPAISRTVLNEFTKKTPSIEAIKENLDMIISKAEE